MDTSEATEPTIKTIPYEKAEQFVQHLQRSHQDWKGAYPFLNDWVFRGQADASWGLTPHAYRDGPNEHVLISRFLQLIEKDYDLPDEKWMEIVQPECEKPESLSEAEWISNTAAAAKYALTHASLVREFTLLSRQTGHDLEYPPFLIHIFNFSRHYTGETLSRPISLEWFFNGHIMKTPFAVAQHHRIPTGLLDWTDNPLVAAYFTIAKLAARAAEIDAPLEGDIAVWALNRYYLDQEFRHICRFTISPKITPFLDAQEGLFTWFPNAYLYFSEHGRFPTLEHAIKMVAQEQNNDSLPQTGIIGPRN